MEESNAERITRVRRLRRLRTRLASVSAVDTRGLHGILEGLLDALTGAPETVEFDEEGT